MAESIAHRDASVINGTVSMGFDTSGLNTSLTGDSFNTTGVSLLENSGRSESRSMLQVTRILNTRTLGASQSLTSNFIHLC